MYFSSLLHHAIRWLKWWWRYGIALTILSFFMLFILQRSTILVTNLSQAVAFDVSDVDFNYFAWEAGAIRAKAAQNLFGQHAYLDEATRSQFVRDYMDDLAHVQQLEAEIDAIYADPVAIDPLSQSTALRTNRDELRQNLRQRQSIAEAILEGQVAAVLVEEGFGVWGQLFPPMAMRFSRMPNLLVISPRDTIRMELSIAIDPMSVDARFALEDQLDADYDIASLVVPLGGIALYPAIIMETASIPYALETFAHEWLHHYLFLYPLGLSYFSGEAGESRRVNETVADLFGKEVARLVLQRYYPEQPLPALPTYDDHPQQSQPEPIGFDFAQVMHETRVHVDELLEQGDVIGAEAYMEAQRQLFFEHGYRIRKINQAFFAFYGGYQAGGGVAGAGGADPIGPAVIAVRAASPTLYDFVRTIRSVNSTTSLQSLLSQP